MHVQIDPSPHVLEDQIGLHLAAPDQNWRQRPDMDPQATRSFRASIVARSRFIEDLVVERSERGVRQYVILGAGLDTFAQRCPEIASRLRIFEVDRPGPQAWKRRRLISLGFGIPEWLRFVPVDFEESQPSEAGLPPVARESWRERLAAAGFDSRQPALVASAGVSMYLTRDANMATMRQVAALAPGTTLAMTFILPVELAPPKERAGIEASAKGARASGTPFVSFFTPPDILAMAREAGFGHVQHISADDIAQRYFAGRADGLRPPSNGEEFLVATI